MEMIILAAAPPPDPDRIVARPFVNGDKCNIRVIRLSPGQSLPTHTPGDSDLMLYAAEDDGVLEPDDVAIPFPRRGEELRVKNDGTEGLMLPAFLAPPSPPARSR